MAEGARSSFWRERRPEMIAATAGVVLSIIWRDGPLPFRGWGVVMIAAVAAALLFTLRARLRVAYAVLELFVAAALAWHASTSLQAAAAVYVGIRGLDNLFAGVGDLRRTPSWDTFAYLWGRLMDGANYRPPLPKGEDEHT